MRQTAVWQRSRMVATWGAVALLAAACAADREPGSLYGPGAGDLVVVFGAGNINQVTPLILEALGEDNGHE